MYFKYIKQVKSDNYLFHSLTLAYLYYLKKNITIKFFPFIVCLVLSKNSCNCLCCILVRNGKIGWVNCKILLKNLVLVTVLVEICIVSVCPISEYLSLLLLILFKGFCNCCNLLSCNKKFMKIVVHIIWVLPHSDKDLSANFNFANM